MRAPILPRAMKPAPRAMTCLCFLVSEAIFSLTFSFKDIFFFFDFVYSGERVAPSKRERDSRVVDRFIFIRY